MIEDIYWQLIHTTHIYCLHCILNNIRKGSHVNANRKITSTPEWFHYRTLFGFLVIKTSKHQLKINVIGWWDNCYSKSMKMIKLDKSTVRNLCSLKRSAFTIVQHQFRFDGIVSDFIHFTNKSGKHNCAVGASLFDAPRDQYNLAGEICRNIFSCFYI